MMFRGYVFPKQSTKPTKLWLLAVIAGMVAYAEPQQSIAQSFGGAFEGMRDSSQPIQIEADRLEVEDKKGTAYLDGNVNVVQGTTILKAGNMRVFYFSGGKNTNGGPNGNIKKIIAGGKVAVRSGDQRATAEEATFDMETQVVVLTGKVTVSQGNNVVTGCSMWVNLETSAAKLQPCAGKKKGRIKMLITPSSNNN